MSTAGRLQDALREAIEGHWSEMGEPDIPGPLWGYDRALIEAVLDAAEDVAWVFIEAERRAAAPPDPESETL